MKKLNQYMQSFNNANEVKILVNDAVYSYLNDEKPNVLKIAILNDLGLLIEG